MKKPVGQVWPVFISSCALVYAFSCHTGKKSEAAPTVPPLQTVILSGDTMQARIKLLVFELTTDATAPAGERCTLIQTQMAPGRLKSALGTPEFVQTGDLICHFYNRQGAIIQTSIQEDPLTAPVEVFEENGSMNRHDLHKTRAEFTLRVQHSPEIHHLLIGKVMPDKSVITLFDFTL